MINVVSAKSISSNGFDCGAQNRLLLADTRSAHTSAEIIVSPALGLDMSSLPSNWLLPIGDVQCDSFLSPDFFFFLPPSWFGRSVRNTPLPEPHFGLVSPTSPPAALPQCRPKTTVMPALHPSSPPASQLDIGLLIPFLKLFLKRVFTFLQFSRKFRSWGVILIRERQGVGLWYRAFRD